MKYTIGFLAALALSASAFATSPKVGPYLAKLVGEKKEAKWKECLIHNNAVVLTWSENGKEKSSVEPLEKMDQDELSKMIKSASKAPTRRALHIIETRPHVRVSAGIFPELADFALMRDASDLVYREGKVTAALVKLVNQLCGKMSLNE